MSQIKDRPVATDAGYEFNYAVWTAGTTVSLHNVRWNSDYRDVVKFNDQAALNNYLVNNAGPYTTINGMTYAKFGHPITIDLPFNATNKFNYLRASNPLQPIAGDIQKDFYYFITNVDYIAPNATRITVQLDVWQTWIYGMTFGNCYIEQGHVGIANGNQMNNFGRDYLTTPEGFDLGNEYVIAGSYGHQIASARFNEFGSPDYTIMVASNTALDTDDYGTVKAPKLQSARGSQMENLPNGCELYEFNSLQHFNEFLEIMADKTWVTQGIISIMATPRATRYGMSTTTKFIKRGDEGAVDFPMRRIDGGVLNNVIEDIAPNWRDTVQLGRYGNLKKFLTSPYMWVEMTSYTGTPLMLRPECWQDANMRIAEIPHLAPPSPRINFLPYRYNASGVAPFIDGNGLVNDGGEFLDMVTSIMNLPTFTIVNNGYISYMAANANGIAYQHSSADWSQQKAMQGISTSYDQASAGIDLSKEMSRLGIEGDTQRTSLNNQVAGVQAIRNGIGAVGQIGNGPLGIVSAASGMVNAGMDYAITTGTNNANLGINTALAQNTNNAQTGNAAYLRDTNRSLAEFSANGDYQNAIAGINARVQDAKLTQPTTAGQVGGDAYNLATYYWGCDFKIKMLQPAAMNAIGEYWLRYGYAINRFGRMPASLKVMEKFTYWKLKETYITEAQCPEAFKQAVRGIFEKGVTVWSNPSDIGNIDLADNEPLAGVYL